MLPPIRQCAEGHNFCDRCCSKLMSTREATARKCPTCRIALTNPVARARNLEQWAAEADVEVQCDYDECGERFKYSEHSEHRKTCLGRTVCCPLRNCSWRGEPGALGEHLRAAADAGGHQLCPTSLPTKYSSRHVDYSTTVIFETSRAPGDARRWRPPRQLISVPANTKLGTEATTFVVGLWKPKGAGQPFLAAIQALRKPGHDETPFSFDLSLSAYPRPPASLCVSRASAVGPVSDLSAVEVWTRPKLKKVKSPVLVADQASIGIFNTASLDVNDHNSLQRYELHVRLVPLIPETTERHAQPHAAGGQVFDLGGGGGVPDDRHGFGGHDFDDDDDDDDDESHYGFDGAEEGQRDGENGSDDDDDDDLSSDLSSDSDLSRRTTTSDESSAESTSDVSSSEDDSTSGSLSEDEDSEYSEGDY